MELDSLTPQKAWGKVDKFCSDIAFLLVLPKEGAAEEKTYSFTMVWVHPYQARVSTIEKAIKQLDQLTPSGPDWPYALVWLNGDACHMPIPTEGHLSVMPEGSTSSIPCWIICQLAVCQLLRSGLQVVYPEGLNRCQIPVKMYLPESLYKGITMLEGKSTFLQVDFSQSATKEQVFKVLSLMVVQRLPWQQAQHRFPSQSRESNQHDHGGQSAPVPGGLGYFQPSIRKFHPKKTSVTSLGLTTPSQNGWLH